MGALCLLLLLLAAVIPMSASVLPVSKPVLGTDTQAMLCQFAPPYIDECDTPIDDPGQGYSYTVDGDTHTWDYNEAEAEASAGFVQAEANSTAYGYAQAYATYTDQITIYVSSGFLDVTIYGYINGAASVYGNIGGCSFKWPGAALGLQEEVCPFTGPTIDLTFAAAAYAGAMSRGGPFYGPSTAFVNLSSIDVYNSQGQLVPDPFVPDPPTWVLIATVLLILALRLTYNPMRGLLVRLGAGIPGLSSS